MLQIAGKAVAGAVEGDAEQKAVRAAHALDRTAIGGDAQQIAGLIAAPDRTVRMDRHAFGMRDARRGENAVEEDPRGRHVEKRLHCDGSFSICPLTRLPLRSATLSPLGRGDHPRFRLLSIELGAKSGRPPPQRERVAERSGGRVRGQRSIILAPNTALDHGPVRRKNFRDQPAALLGADELQPAQSPAGRCGQRRISSIIGGGQRQPPGNPASNFDIEAGGLANVLAADAWHRFDHHQFARRRVEPEDAKIGEHQRLAGPIAMRRAFGSVKQSARRTGDLDTASTTESGRMPGDVEQVVAVHVGDVGHAALSGQADDAAVALAQRDGVDAAATIDLRRRDDLVGHRAGLVIGRVGVVAAGMRDGRLAIQPLDQRQDHRARRDVEMAALIVAMIMSGACVAFASR